MDRYSSASGRACNRGLCNGNIYGSGTFLRARDALLVAMGKRLKKFPIGAVKMIIDGFAVAIGFILGAKVGIGTVVAVFGMGFILQGAFKVMKFDATAVTHESIIGTVNRLKRINENTR